MFYNLLDLFDETKMMRVDKQSIEKGSYFTLRFHPVRNQKLHLYVISVVFD